MYFVTDVVDGAILIKTFLFITNDGTPKGENINKFVGISRSEKKFFKIDSLSTFFFSDIEGKETLSAIFIKAGCESLFKFKQ